MLNQMGGEFYEDNGKFLPSNFCLWIWAYTHETIFVSETHILQFQEWKLSPVVM